MQSSTVDLDGPVHFADFGGSGEPIVLVHGLGGSYANWLAVGDALAKRGRVLAVDLAGFGLTPSAGRPATPAGNRRLLSRFLREVAGKPAVLVGSSMGGLISLMQAAVEPETVSRLVLVDAALPRAPRARLDPLVAAGFVAYALPVAGGLFIRIRDGFLGPERLVDETLKLCCAHPERVPASAREAMISVAKARHDMPSDTTGYAKASRSLVGSTLRPRALRRTIQDVITPALVIHGARDRLVPVASARHLVLLRPDWLLKVFDDAGHLPQLEVPETFVETLSAWLDSARHPG